MNTSDVLDRAADEIERRGWSQGTGWFPNPNGSAPVCAEGAIRLCREVGDRAALDALSDYLQDRYPECINPTSGCVIPFSWNDRPERTASEVIEVLRAAAMVERTREAAREPEAVSA